MNEFWDAIYGKVHYTIKVEDNNTVMDIKEEDFEFLQCLSNEGLPEPEYLSRKKLHVTFICGLIKGGLLALGYKCDVDFEILNSSYTFYIKS